MLFIDLMLLFFICLFIFHLITTAWSFSAVSNRGSEGEDPGLIFGLGRKAISFSLLSGMVAVGLSPRAFLLLGCILRYCFSDNPSMLISTPKEQRSHNGLQDTRWSRWSNPHVFELDSKSTNPPLDCIMTFLRDFLGNSLSHGVVLHVKCMSLYCVPMGHRVGRW